MPRLNRLTESVVAPGSLKGNMRSARVCDLVAAAILREMPDAIVRKTPMADGGEDTFEALIASSGGSTPADDRPAEIALCVRFLGEESGT